MQDSTAPFSRQSLLSHIFFVIKQALAIADEAVAYKQTILLSVAFLATGTITFIAAVAQTFWFSIASINLTTRIR